MSQPMENIDPRQKGIAVGKATKCSQEPAEAVLCATKEPQ
jgi:hypothetical protein